MNILRLAFPLLCLLVVVACSGTEEQVKTDVPIIRVDTVAAPQIDTRVFKYNERYFVRGALLAKATNFDDPVQALRVVQLVQGAHDALVISSFDKDGETPTETWVGIEFDHIEPGTYSIETATAFQFYRFYLGDVRKRFDGINATGSLTVTELTNDAIIGVISLKVEGVIKSFESNPEPANLGFDGSFRIGRVALEDTMMKGR